MAKLKLPIVIDSIFIFFSAFFILYALLKSSIISIVSTALLTSFLSLIITVIFMLTLAYFDDKKGLKKQEELSILTFNNYLRYLTNVEFVWLFKKLLDKENIEYKNKENAFYFEESKSVLVFNFTPLALQENDVLCLYKTLLQNYNLYILALDYKIESKDILSINNLKLYTAKDLYFKLKSYNMLPSLPIKTKEKIKLKPLISNLFDKKHVKKYFLWGAVMCLFSTLTYFKVFYLSVGTIFILISIYLKFFKDEKVDNLQK